MGRKIASQKGYKKKSDTLFSLIIRSVNECEAMGYGDRPCSYQMQCAHIISRRYSSTRTDLRNAFCLCASHHSWFTDHPREFSRFITGTWAQDFYEAVYAKSLLSDKVDWEERAEFLKDVLDRIVEGELTLKEARLYE